MSHLCAYEWKPFFHGAAAIEVASLSLRFIFAIDANEPRSETATRVEFHWDEARPGHGKLEALLGLTPRHRARDLLREGLERGDSKPAGPDHLALTYTTRGKGQRRFDSIWATEEFELSSLTTHYEEALAVGADHALLAATVTF